MLTVRLPEKLEKDLERLAEENNTTKSKIVKEAVRAYIAEKISEKSSYEIGEQFFGKYGSDFNNLSTEYKKALKEKLREKHSH